MANRFALLPAIAAFSFSATSVADPLTVTSARITRLQVYETGNNPNVWIYLNGNSRVGSNPANPGVTCELWTNDKTVHATALAAMLAGKAVDISYVDNSNGSFWCKVQSLAIVE
jgi:hypothetical protein